MSTKYVSSNTTPTTCPHPPTSSSPSQEELTHTTHTHLSHFHSRGLLSSAVYNLRDPSSIRSTISTAATFLDNRIDILVNNASIASPKWKDNRTFADEATLEEWQAYVETNLTAPFVVSQACIPYMRNVVEGEGGGGGQGKGGAGPCSEFSSLPSHSGVAVLWDMS